MIKAYLVVADCLTIYDPVIKFSDLCLLLELHKDVGVVNVDVIEIDDADQFLLEKRIEFRVGDCNRKMLQWLMGDLAVVKFTTFHPVKLVMSDREEPLEIGVGTV